MAADTNKTTLPLRADSKLKKTGAALTSSIHDEVVMMNVKQGSYYSLNPVASEIWELLDKHHTVPSLISELTKIYEVDPEVCESQLVEYLNELITEGLVEVDQ